MSSTKDTKAKVKKANSPSLRIIHPEEVLQKMSFSQYDEEPTIIFLASNRDSMNSTNYRPSSKGHPLRKRKSRILTYESNLMQSSPQRSESSAVDGEFVCKYLTPIKKQQFEKLLFRDQIDENDHDQKTKPTKLLRNQRKPKISKPTVQDKEQIFITSQKHKNVMYSNMIKSFHPCGSIHETDQNTQSQIKEKNQSASKIKEITSTTKISSTPSIFVDPNAQVYFLKSNNNELFKKLQAQIQKNKNLEQNIQKFLNQNKSLSEKNLKQQNFIIHLKQIIFKFEEERRNYVAKEWQEFQLVKNMLIEKRKSKSKESFKRNQIPKKIIDPKMNVLKKLQKVMEQGSKQKEPKISLSEQKFSVMKENPDSFFKEFSSGKMNLSNNCNTIQLESDLKNNSLTKKQRKMSFQKNSQSKKYSTKKNQKGLIQRILQDKIFINEQNRCKKSVRSSPSRKTCRKNGSVRKQNFVSGSKQLNQR